MTVNWNTEAFFEKASKGSFAARAARTDVFKNNCEIFQAGGYVSESGKEVILNLADAYHACGFYHRGSHAQEESLCRQTTLSQSLYQYYSKNSAELSGVPFKEKKYPMDIRYGAVYSPHTTVFRRGPRHGYALLDNPYDTAFISCAALDFNEKHGKNHEFRSADGGFIPEGKDIMISKIRTILSVALANGHDAVVLGAFGCGAFRLRPDLVAGLFSAVLSEQAFKNRFKIVSFAILEKDGPESGADGKFAPFYRLFGQYGA